jgi:hypothetical protein
VRQKILHGSCVFANFIFFPLMFYKNTPIFGPLKPLNKQKWVMIPEICLNVLETITEASERFLPFLRQKNPGGRFLTSIRNFNNAYNEELYLKEVNMAFNREIKVDLVKKEKTHTEPTQSGIGFEEKAKIISGLVENAAIKIGLAVGAYVILDTVRKVAVASVTN